MTGAVLAYRTLGLGDLFTAVPALRGLRRAFPDRDLVLATPSWLAPLVDLIDAVDRLRVTPERGSVTGRFDVAVNLHGRGPQSTQIVADVEPGRLIAFDASGVEWRADEHEVHRWCRLLQEHGIACDPTDLDVPIPHADVARGVTVVHVGAKAPARRWVPARFAAVARALPDVVITGDDDERPTAERVAAEAGLSDDRVLAGRVDLREFAALVGHARAVVTGDTGVQHLATAFRTPSVVLFGPVPPSEWGPPPERTEHIALWAGRRGDPHGRRTDPGLLAIGVEDVLAAYETLADRGHVRDRFVHRARMRDDGVRRTFDANDGERPRGKQ
ncbi:MAG: glycosyltransferase family 9 protein [Actinobacteria bacterium]|nr:glycosyltransferase family 9 protein [Actinomycetota bacterium]